MLDRAAYNVDRAANAGLGCGTPALGCLMGGGCIAIVILAAIALGSSVLVLLP